MNVDDGAVEQSATDARTSAWLDRKILDVLSVLARNAPVGRAQTEATALGAPDIDDLGIAQPRRRLGQCVEESLQIKRRTTDDLEHISGGGLLLQRFAQLMEETGVLDSDHGLGSEVRYQLDLLLGERPYLLSVDRDDAN